MAPRKHLAPWLARQLPGLPPAHLAPAPLSQSHTKAENLRTLEGVLFGRVLIGHLVQWSSVGRLKT